MNWITKNKSLFWAIAILGIFGLFPPNAFSQASSQEKFKEGLEHFYNVRFHSAIEALQDAISQGGLSEEELFDAYLYIGFSLVRQGGQLALAEEVFRETVKLDPKRKLDPLKIPPDLLKKFEEVRKSMLGAIYISSTPPGAQVVGFSQQEELGFRGTTPQLFEDLIVGSYDIAFMLANYQEEVVRVDLSSARVDSLNVTLRLKRKPFYKQWGTWVIVGSGAALATVVVLISKLEPSKPPSDLPSPPDHPQP